MYESHASYSACGLGSDGHRPARRAGARGGCRRAASTARRSPVAAAAERWPCSADAGARDARPRTSRGSTAKRPAATPTCSKAALRARRTSGRFGSTRPEDAPKCRAAGGGLEPTRRRRDEDSCDRRRGIHRQPHRKVSRCRGPPARDLRRHEPGARLGGEVGTARARQPLRSGTPRGRIRAARDRGRGPFRRQRARWRVDGRPGRSTSGTTRSARSTCSRRCTGAGVGTIVFSSTCATYGDPVRVPIDETHPQAPVNPYGESKLMVEQMLRWYGEIHGLRWMALRYFNAAGADPDSEIGEEHDPETHLIPLVIGAAQGKRPAGEDLRHGLPDRRRNRDPRLHPRHGSGGCPSPRARPPRLGNGEPGDQSRHRPGHSVREVVDTVSRVAGRPVPVVEAPRRAGDPRGARCCPRAGTRGAAVDVPLLRSRDDRPARVGVAREARLSATAADRRRAP